VTYGAPRGQLGGVPLKLFGKTIAILVMGLACIGCIHAQRHPKTWDPPVFEMGSSPCPALNGIYENMGVDPKGGAVNLARLLNYSIRHDPAGARERNRFYDELGNVSSVKLELSGDGVLLVRVGLGAGEKDWSFSQAKGQLLCKGGILSIQQRGDGIGDNVVAYESATLDLFRVNNDLIVHKHGGSAGVMLLVPMAGYESTWGRFAFKQAD